MSSAPSSLEMPGEGEGGVAFSPQKDSASFQSSAWNCLSGSCLHPSWASAHHPIATQKAVWASTIYPPSASGIEPRGSCKGLRLGLEVSRWRIRTFVVPGLRENPHIQRGQSQFPAPHTDRTGGRQMTGGVLRLHLPWKMLLKGVGISKGKEPLPFLGSQEDTSGGARISAGALGRSHLSTLKLCCALSPPAGGRRWGRATHTAHTLCTCSWGDRVSGAHPKAPGDCAPPCAHRAWAVTDHQSWSLRVGPRGACPASKRMRSPQAIASSQPGARSAPQLSRFPGPDAEEFTWR